MSPRPRRASIRLLLLIALLAPAFAVLPAAAQEPAPEAAEGDSAAADAEEEGGDTSAAAVEDGGEAEASEPEEHPLVIEARRRHSDLEEIKRVNGGLLPRIEAATGFDRIALEEQLFRAELEYHQTMVALTQNLFQQEDAGLDTAEARGRLSDLWEDNLPGYRKAARWRRARTVEARDAVEEAKPEERIQAQQAVTEQEARLQTLFRVVIEAEDQAERLGVDIAGGREKSRKRVTERGENIAGRLRVAAQARRAATDRLAASPEDADAKLNLEVAQLRVEREAENLHKTIALLTHLDEPTAAHQQLLIEATGEITPGIFDREVLRGLLSAWREEVSERIQTKGPAWVIRTFLFLLILAVFALVAAVVRRFVGASVGSARLGLSMLLQRTLVNWSSRVVMLIGFMVALGQLGVQIGTLLAGLGIAGFIIGFALQDSLSNFAAGAMILGYRPFDMGDVIEAAGVQGVVSDMSLVTTTVRTYDNQTLILPNTKIWGDVIRILTDQKTRRVDLAYPIAFDADVERISGFMREILAEHDAVLPEPSPLVEVHSVGDSCLELVVRPWVQTEDYWPIRWSVNRAVVKRLREEGIHLQVPRRDIRTLSDDA